MKQYTTLAGVLEDLAGLEWFGVLYANKEQWKRQPEKTEFLYLETDDEIEDIADEETLQPRIAQALDKQYFLDVQMFKAIIEKQLEQKTNSDTHDFVGALNHYREYDDFKVV
jgi:hypothetical protein